MKNLEKRDDNITDKYINGIYELIDSEFDENTMYKAKLCVLDYIGVTLAGSKAMEKKINKMVRDMDLRDGTTKIFGIDLVCSFENAIFMNGLSSHALELDDGVRYGALHPGAPILSALLPYANKNRVTGVDVLRSVIIGYEAAINLAYSIQPSHTNKGYHPSATCGSIGAAVALAVSEKFSKNKLKAVVSNAAISTSGTLKVIEGNSQLKPSNIAKASLNALYAIYLTKAGFNIPNDVLSGDNGLLKILATEYDENILFNLNDKEFKINKVYFKNFAACRHCHTGIEAAIYLRSSNDISIDGILDINIYSYDYVIGKHDHTVVENVSSAKMSIPYSVAIALIHGSGSEEFYSDSYINDVEVQRLMRKVNVMSSKELSELVPKKRPSIVEIIMKDSGILSKRIDFPKGEPENPFTDIELIDKFRSLALYAGKSEDEIDEIIHCVMNIENEFHKLIELI